MQKQTLELHRGDHVLALEDVPWETNPRDDIERTLAADIAVPCT